MVEFTINIVFAGLIAFVPNSIDNPEFITAYLVEDHILIPECHHIPELYVVGKSQIASGDSCSYLHSEVLRCELSKTDISLIPTPKEKPNFQRRKPPGDLPNDQTDGASLSWLVRMANVENSANRLKGWDDLVKADLVGARFRFGWDSARTCKLDDKGEDKVYSFEFEEGSYLSEHRQAVAERIVFTSKLDPGHIQLELYDRDSKKLTSVRLKCPGGHCPTMIVQNEIAGECPQEEHFHPFYDVARNPAHMPIPVRTGTPVVESYVSVDCMPPLPSFDLILGPLAILRHFAGWSRLTLGSNAIEDQVERALGTKPDSRIICPPALFDQ